MAKDCRSMIKHNVECFKCQDYGHMAKDCKNNMARSTRQKVTKVWRTKSKDSKGGSNTKATDEDFKKSMSSGGAAPKRRDIDKGSCSRTRVKRKNHPFLLMSKGERKIISMKTRGA